MLRDTLKDKEYFLEYISEEEDRINALEECINYLTSYGIEEIILTFRYENSKL